MEAARLIAALARMVGDVGLAEEFAQEALVAALQQWPVCGVPDNPGAWLMAVAKRRAVDQRRRNQRLQRKVAELGRDLDTESGDADLDHVLEEDLGDDLLRLVFIACHPV
ncbi:MAG: RNA polymerase subunit sigma-24, partial [Actinomycetota bacterium]|nr:RNA polymerase subunit sigma-24 [Actinomycetota bacterium]